MEKSNDDLSCGCCGGELEGPPSSHCKVDGKTVHAHCFDKALREKIQGGFS